MTDDFRAQVFETKAPETTHDAMALAVNNLSVSYDKIPILWDITLQIPQGKLVGIVGPNGAGKSTFIKTVLGLVKPVSGNFKFFDAPLKDTRHRIAYVPQRETVDWDFPITVHDLVLMGCYGRLGVFRRPRSADMAAANHYMEMMGIAHLAERQISQLSGGQQQRAFLARALLQEADIYFMDEPFTGIDLATESIIMDLLRRLIAQKKTVFVVHHDLNTVEAYFDWAMLINMRLIANGPLAEAFTPETLHATYGKSYALFGEALKLSQSKTIGLKS